MSKRRHEMPFGAQLLPTGGVSFRLWAPAARIVDLILQGGRSLRMNQQPDGWHDLLVPDAGAGTRYQYRIDDGLIVPDPASRRNPDDVHGPSEVVDAGAFDWSDEDWRAPPWHAAVVYELHVGTFSPAGTFAGVEQRLEHLVELGITAIELMPIADFPGRCGWGYDGVLLFAPESAYGTPEELKSLVVAAHKRGLAVMLDVVYNHFGPEGNYLGAYAPQFFTERHHTPWGAAINFDGECSGTVRDFYIHNTLYWLEEYHLDGLRYDAVHAIKDDSARNIMTDIAAAARTGPGRDRHVYLVLENGANQAQFLGAPGAQDTFDAQWNDDAHHCLHTILTRESDGYYVDYAEEAHALLCRSLAEGFAYQGQPSAHEGHRRGERSAHLPPTAFVNFLQNHDQIGNRALGERLSHLVRDEEALRAAAAVLLLAPNPPMLFMGEEWDAPQPFPYFCDFGPELAAAVRDGRRREFARFGRFSDAEALASIPDPTARETLQSARLDWSQLAEPANGERLDYYRRLLALRRRDIAPRIPEIRGSRCTSLEKPGLLCVDWGLADGSTLHLIANLWPEAVPMRKLPVGRLIFATHPNVREAMKRKQLSPWSVTWLLERGP